MAETRVFALEIVIALRLRNVLRGALIALRFRHPDPAVIAERFGHESELRLEIAALWNAGRVDLCVAGIRERRAALVCAPDRRGIGRFGVGREIEDVDVAA